MIKKILLASIGFVDVTREKAEEIADELVKRGEVSNSDKAKTVREIVDKAEERTANLRSQIDERIQQLHEKFRRKDSEILVRLEEKLDEISARVAELEKK